MATLAAIDQIERLPQFEAERDAIYQTIKQRGANFSWKTLAVPAYRLGGFFLSIPSSDPAKLNYMTI